jgi:hypothetical protein
MKNIIKTAVYSTVALSSIAYTSAAGGMFGKDKASRFA